MNSDVYSEKELKAKCWSSQIFCVAQFSQIEAQNAIEMNSPQSVRIRGNCTFDVEVNLRVLSNLEEFKIEHRENCDWLEVVKDDHQKVAVEMNWKQWAEHSSLSDTELKDFLLDVFDTTRCLFLGEHEPDEMTEENLEIPNCLFKYSTRQHVQLFIRFFNFKRSPAQIKFKWHNFEKW